MFFEIIVARSADAMIFIGLSGHAMNVFDRIIKPNSC